MRLRRCLAVAWPILCVSGCTVADPTIVEEPPEISEAVKDRAHNSSVALFSSMLGDVTREKDLECQIDSQWNNTPVGAGIAVHYLGSKLYADLLAPYFGPSIEDTMDPSRKLGLQFCTEEESDARWAAKLKALREKEIPLTEEDGKTFESISRTRIKISRPIFDRNFNTAALTASFHSEKFLKVNPKNVTPDMKFYKGDGIGRPFPEGASYTYVYRLKSGKWEMIYWNPDSIFN